MFHLKPQRPGGARLFQLFRTHLLPLDSGRAGASCMSHISWQQRYQGIGRKVPLEPGSQPAASRDCLVGAPGEIIILRERPTEMSELQMGPELFQFQRRLLPFTWMCGRHGSLASCHILVLASS